MDGLPVVGAPVPLKAYRDFLRSLELACLRLAAAGRTSTRMGVGADKEPLTMAAIRRWFRLPHLR
jgi:hypothetical protein